MKVRFLRKAATDTASPERQVSALADIRFRNLTDSTQS